MTKLSKQIASAPGEPHAGADARFALLEGLIDDAGLFPPSSRPMAEAARSHRASKAGPHGWVMRRFIVPGARLSDLALQFGEAEPFRWRLSVIVGGGEDGWSKAVHRDLHAARRFVDRVGPTVARVEAVETAVPADLARSSQRLTEALERFLDALDESGLPGPVLPFFEIPVAGEQPNIPAAIGAVAGLDVGRGRVAEAAGAKIRCGGSDPSAFPSPERVAAFISSCAGQDVRFKATAGLHRPFRHLDPETGFVRHGFLNLAAATAFVLSDGLDGVDLEEVLADDRPDHFALTSEGLAWKDRFADDWDLAVARRLFAGYGSCDFAEPIDALASMGALPGSADGPGTGG
jgi:hypothetical protein